MEISASEALMKGGAAGWLEVCVCVCSLTCFEQDDLVVLTQLHEA